MPLTSENPATGEIIHTYEEISDREIDEHVKRAHQAFDDWRRQHYRQRAEFMNRAAEVLRAGRDEYARLMATEMGKPIKDGWAEVNKCAAACEFFASQASQMLAPERVDSDARKSYITFQPLGVILGVMPWNFPFWQVFRFAVPALMAGNACLLKHASNVSGCSLAIADIFTRAGFPEHLFQSLLISGKRVDAVLDHPLVRAVSLTGSTAAGSAIAAGAGKRLKKSVLELGGSDPYIILDDAPMEKAVADCVTSRLLNSGQSCIAAKRFIVLEATRETFETAFVAAMKKIKMGDPLDETMDIGPQARDDLRATLHRQVQQSLEKGARLLLGGEIPEGRGAFYPPTVLTDVSPGMPAFDEETFGPVAAIIPVKDEEHAIRLANDSRFGLGAAVFTSDLQRGERIASVELQAGTCCVNTYVRSDPRLPFGGIKESGFGRELASYGIKEFVNIKTVYLG